MSLNYECSILNVTLKFFVNFSPFWQLVAILVSVTVFRTFTSNCVFTRNFSYVIHVGQWVEHFKIGLGFVVEHTGEAIHHSFDLHCLNTALIADYKHPGYLGDLKKKTVAYVSGNCRRVPGKRLW